MTDCSAAPQFVTCVQLDTLIALVSVVIALLLVLTAILIWLASQRGFRKNPSGSVATGSYKSTPSFPSSEGIECRFPELERKRTIRSSISKMTPLDAITKLMQ